MSAITIVEPTTLIRDWLRDQGLSVDQNIWAGGRPAADPNALGIVLYSVGGGPVDYQMDGVYQFDCLQSNARDAAALAGELASLLLSTQLPIALTSQTRLEGFYGVQMLADFDSDPDLARHIVTAQATTITTP